MQTTERRLGRIASGFNARARKHRSLGVVSAETLRLIDIRFGGRCYYCPTVMGISDGTWDHQVALSEGGRNDISNIVRCCMDCQRKKFTKTPAEFDQHRQLTVICPIDGVEFHPRWAEWQAGRARYCSHRCAGAARWLQKGSA